MNGEHISSPPSTRLETRIQKPSFIGIVLKGLAMLLGLS